MRQKKKSIKATTKNYANVNELSLCESNTLLVNVNNPIKAKQWHSHTSMLSGIKLRNENKYACDVTTEAWNHHP